jgi:succinyl-diaminopimelate desuccinylase
MKPAPHTEYLSAERVLDIASDLLALDTQNPSVDTRPLGERGDDRRYGRGTTDTKGPLAAMLHVAEAFGETDTTPPVDLAFAFASDEETGGNAAVYARIPAAYDEAVG